MLFFTNNIYKPSIYFQVDIVTLDFIKKNH